MKVWLSRIGWTLWALVPVAALSLHFGPAQRWDRREQAERLILGADAAQREATRLQGEAYEAHLAALAARMKAAGTEDAALAKQAADAAEAESVAATRAEGAWRRVVDGLSPAIELMRESDAAIERELRVARAHAAVRSGDIGEGADDLEALLDDLASEGKGESELARKARAELGTAYYYGARLLRMSGKPAEVWREVAGQARQQFRYLAEHEPESATTRAGVGPRGAIANVGDAEASHGASGVAGSKAVDASGGTMPQASAADDNRRNVELVLNLEQSSLDELYARARPKDSPIGAGNRLGKGKKRGRGPNGNGPPQNGAGMGDEVGPGW
ncbi:MAG: hypothetical protein U0638_06345 [Phycisphaerales bacterium]